MGWRLDLPGPLLALISTTWVAATMWNDKAVAFTFPTFVLWVLTTYATALQKRSRASVRFYSVVFACLWIAYGIYQWQLPPSSLDWSLESPLYFTLYQPMALAISFLTSYRYAHKQAAITALRRHHDTENSTSAKIPGDWPSSFVEVDNDGNEYEKW